MLGHVKVPCGQGGVVPKVMSAASYVCISGPTKFRSLEKHRKTMKNQYGYTISLGHKLEAQ